MQEQDRRRNSPSSEAGDYDEWSSVIALEDSRKQLDWRSQLRDDGQYDRESDLGSPGPRLLDRHQGDFELMQELFVWRVRHRGADGISSLWQYILQAASEHNTRLWEFPRMWRAMEDLAAADSDALSQVVAHVKLMQGIYRDKPDGFYERIMSANLQWPGSDLLDVQQALEPVSPDWTEMKAFFIVVAKDSKSLKRFQSIAFRASSFSGMYTFVISHLTEQKMLSEAVSWHHALLANNDIPVDASITEQLRAQLARKGQRENANKILADLASKNVPGAVLPGRRGSQDEHAVQTKSLVEAMQTHLGSGTNVQLTDKFTSRLFATRFFSIYAIIQGLRMIQLTSIDALTFREAILRVSRESSTQSNASSVGLPQVTPQHVRALLDMLDKAGIAVTRSTFARVVISLANECHPDLLQDTIECDQHPEAFEDLVLQEKLLAYYMEHDMRLAAQRTLFVIRVHNPSKYGSTTDLDVIYLMIMSHDNDQKFNLKMVESILRRQGEVTHGAFQNHWAINVSARSRSRRGHRYHELARVVRHLTMSMQSGTHIGPYAWREAFRRLGWSMKLLELEALCKWLVRWTCQPSFRLQSGLSGTGTLTSNSRRNLVYLRRIFNSTTLQALVTWGMEKWALSQRVGPHRRTSQHSTEQSEQAFHRRRLLWGVYLLRNLRDLGLPLDEHREEIREACRLGLVRLFGAGWSAKPTARRLQMLGKGQKRAGGFVEIAAAMEGIWGEPIFFRKYAKSARVDDADSAARLLMYELHFLSKQRAKLRSGKLKRALPYRPSKVRRLKRSSGARQPRLTHHEGGPWSRL